MINAVKNLKKSSKLTLQQVLTICEFKFMKHLMPHIISDSNIFHTRTRSRPRSRVRQTNQLADNSLKDREDKHDSKLSSKKMASVEATPAVKRICSKDHKVKSFETKE